MSVKVQKEGIVLDPQSADPSTPKEGQMQMADGTARTAGLWQYVGAAWVQVPLGAGSLSVASKTTTYTITTADDVVLCDASSASFSVTLPTAVGNSGKVLYIQKTDADLTKILTIDGDGTETIDGSLTIKIVNQWNSIILVSNGTNWNSLASSIFGFTLLQEAKSSGTDGGEFAGGAWRIRDLNTQLYDADFCSLTASRFTLDPGTYLIDGWSAGYRVNEHQTKLYDFTNTADIEFGSSNYAHDSFPSSPQSRVVAKVTLTAATAFELRHYCTTTKSTDGLGNAGANGDKEVYSQVLIQKLK